MKKKKKKLCLDDQKYYFRKNVKRIKRTSKKLDYLKKKAIFKIKYMRDRLSKN